MLSNAVFYHQITRKIIVAFGSMFSNIKIARQDSTGAIAQTLDVPIAYAPKEKWLVRVEQDPTLSNNVYTVLPRMSFEITGMSYDSTRKTNKMSYITCADNNGVKKIFSPVPYNYDISLYVLTKTQEDALQIVEQILPFFTPEYNLKVKAINDSDIIMDVPVVFNSVSIQDDYDGDFQTRRFVTYTLNFTLKSNFYGPTSNGEPIAKTIVDVRNMNNNIQNSYAKNTIIGNPTTGQVISDIWAEF